MLYSENGKIINMRLTISVTGKIPEIRKNPFGNSLKKGQRKLVGAGGGGGVGVGVGGGCGVWVVPYDVFKG